MEGRGSVTLLVARKKLREDPKLTKRERNLPGKGKKVFDWASQRRSRSRCKPFFLQAVIHYSMGWHGASRSGGMIHQIPPSTIRNPLIRNKDTAPGPSASSASSQKLTMATHSVQRLVAYPNPKFGGLSHQEAENDVKLNWLTVVFHPSIAATSGNDS